VAWGLRPVGRIEDGKFHRVSLPPDTEGQQQISKDDIDESQVRDDKQLVKRDQRK
jgi:hypothetical protein